jgi:hypothetical protein
MWYLTIDLDLSLFVTFANMIDVAWGMLGLCLSEVWISVFFL